MRFDLDGKVCVAIDTAGVRKSTKMRERVEHWAHDRAMMSVRRADVCLLMIDATQEISGIDKRLGQTVLEEYKPCIIVVNKWDLVEGKVGRKGTVVTVEDYLEYIGKELKGMTHCPIVFTSAHEGTGVRETVELAFELAAQARLRVSTSKLNDIVRNILKVRGPSSKLGSRVKVLYVSQVEVAPPTIVLVVNHPDFFTAEYERYMLNRLREETEFKEVPIRLIVRERRRAELDDLLSGRHQQQRRAAGGPAGGGAAEGGASLDADDEALTADMLEGEDDLPEGFEMGMEEEGESEKE